MTRWWLIPAILVGAMMWAALFFFFSPLLVSIGVSQ